MGGGENVWRKGNHGRARVVRLESLRAGPLNLEVHLAGGIPWPTPKGVHRIFPGHFDVKLALRSNLNIYRLVLFPKTIKFTVYTVIACPT